MGRPLVPLPQRAASQAKTLQRQVQVLQARLDAYLPAVPGGTASVTFSATAPASPRVDDLWYDTANGMQVSQWNGTAWVPYQYGTQAIAPSGVQSANIAANAVGNSQLASNAVGTANIQPSAVGTSQIATGAVTGTQLAGSVTARSLGGITTTISGTAPASPNANDIWINSSAGNQINQYSGSAWTPVTWTASNVIAAGSITAAQIAANTITASQLAAGIVYAGIINGTTVNAATFNGSVFEGTDFIINSAGAFFYSGTPATGNLIASIAPSAGTDAFSNAYPAGIAIFRSSNSAAQVLSFLTGQSYESTPARMDSFVIGSGPGAQLVLNIQSAFVTNRLDSAAIIMESSTEDGTTASAQGLLAYVATSGAAVTMAAWGPGGLIGLGTMAAVDPTTGTPASPAAAETWHNITLDSGWTAGGQVPEYRLLADGNVQVRGSATHAGTTAATNINGSNPIPTAYQPSQTRIYRQPIAQDAAGTVQIGTNGVFAMRASGFSATQAILDGIYSVA